MEKKIEGFVLTEVPYGDHSKILNILTPDLGLIGIIAQGVKSLKSTLRTKACKYTYGMFYIDYREGKLSYLKDIDVIEPLNNIREDIELNSYMSYITDLTYQVIKQNDDPEIYNIYKNVVLKLNEKLDPLILTNILELRYLEYLGIGLNLDECIKCGSKTDIVTLDPDAGGFICKKCYQNEKIMSQKAVKLIYAYSNIKIESISNITITKSVAEEINYFIDKYYERYAGLYLKSKDYLKNMLNNLKKLKS